MIPNFTSSALSITITRTSTRLSPALRPHASRCLANWFSSRADQRNRTDRNDFPRASARILVPPSDEMVSGRYNTAGNDGEASDAAAVTDIEDIHRQAILQKQSTYIDPSTGFTVFTELAHLKRGKCCGNHCRHCPFGWSNVKTGAGGVDAAESNAKVISGDSLMTGRLVRRILDGTYYDDDDSTPSGATEQASARERSDATSCDGHLNESKGFSSEEVISKSRDRVRSGATEYVKSRQGNGGRAGGTYTSKNVPYTRKGDTGTSQLFTGERRNKDDMIFEALGTVDELCSVVGVVYAELNASCERKQKLSAEDESKLVDSKPNSTTYGDLPEQLLEVMSRLFDVGSHIARPTAQNQQSNQNENVVFQSQHTELLELWIDAMTDELPELTSFILPTGCPASAQLHVARTVCRRAERRMVPLVQEEATVDPAALAYVNRLSDYFFTAARFANYCDDRDEVQYRREGSVMGKAGAKQANFQRERVVVKLKR